MFAPTGTPRDVTAKIANVVGEYLSTEPARDRFRGARLPRNGFDAQKWAEIIGNDERLSPTF
jgi:hypothetical protein